MSTPAELRRTLRQLRNQITPTLRHQYNCAINQRILRSGLLLRASSIASVLPNDGEVDLSLLIQTCTKRCIPHFLPIIKKNKQLSFAHYYWGDPLAENQYGIPEPINTIVLPTPFLTTVIVPLVGFDLSGNRLGMGGGYYDRTLAFINQTNCMRRPLLVGAAYETQLSHHLTPNAWDVKLDVVVTEKRLLAFSKRAKAQLFNAL